MKRRACPYSLGINESIFLKPKLIAFFPKTKILMLYVSFGKSSHSNSKKVFLTIIKLCQDKANSS